MCEMAIKLIFVFFMLATLTKTAISQSKANKYCSEIFSKLPRFHSIIGGTQTKNGEFPHMVALGYNDDEKIDWLCGGSLISPRFVLTAGHCAQSYLGPVEVVRLGTRNLKNSTRYFDVLVKKIIQHPKYKPPSLYNDIALLELAEDVIFSKNVIPACLHTNSSIPSSKLTATGWGRIDFAGPTSDDLLKVTLQTVARDTCNTYFKNIGERKLQNGVNNRLQLCANGGPDGGKDTCQGDSGGPLSYKIGRNHYIAGITSFGKACGVANVPAVYTRISAYVPWIESKVWS